MQTLNKSSFAVIHISKRNKKCRICGTYILLSHDLLNVCNPNGCLPIQMQDAAKDNVTSENIYSLPSAPHSHTKSNSLSSCCHEMWL